MANHLELEMNRDTSPLKICLLSYRSNPHCGGQGVYIRNLSRSLKRLGHDVDVISGIPAPDLDKGINLILLPGLNLYNESSAKRFSFDNVKTPVDLIECFSVFTMGFPEPLTFGLRAYHYLKSHTKKYDIIHDNQSLSYGILALSKRFPVITTIHHPITIDRDIAINCADSFMERIRCMRFYSFIGMQKRVARKLSRLITVSACSQRDIQRDFQIPADKFCVIPNGIDTTIFHPLPGINREKNRIVVTNSADTPLKGLSYLIHAVYQLSRMHHIKLIVIGQPKKDSKIIRMIHEMGLENDITFTGRISDAELVKQYAKASIAVVPSLYEGFGLPVGEAMACGVPVISTTGGALPEVVGDCGILVPPADSAALFTALTTLIENPFYAQKLGQQGLLRMLSSFTWQKAADFTLRQYRKTMTDFHQKQNRFLAPHALPTPAFPANLLLKSVKFILGSMNFLSTKR